METIAIIGALEREITIIKKSLKNLKTHKNAGLKITVGEYKNKKIICTVSGIGLINASATTQFLITKYSPKTIIFTGIAGSMDKTVNLNNIIIGSKIITADSDNAIIAESFPHKEFFESNAKLMNIVKEFNVIKNKIFVGTVVSSNKFIDSKLKANLKKRFPDSLCCDMESSATAQIATKNNIPFIIIRTIADNSFETLQNLMANNYKFDSQKYANSSAILSLNIVNKL